MTPASAPGGARGPWIVGAVVVVALLVVGGVLAFGHHKTPRKSSAPPTNTSTTQLAKSGTTTSTTSAPPSTETTTTSHTAPLPTTTLAAPARSTAQPYWIISRSRLDMLLQGGMPQSLATYFFNHSTTFINQGGNGTPVTSADIAAEQAKYPLANMNLLLNSFGPNTLTGSPGIQALFSGGGSYPAGIKSVQYDPEGPADGTPTDEQTALEEGNLTYVDQAAALVHQHGLLFIFSPSVDVGMTPAQEGSASQVATAQPIGKYSTWLAQDRGAWARSSEADVYAIQSQQIEGTPEYDAFMSAAVAQVRAANASIPVITGIGINPGGAGVDTVITTLDLLEAYSSAKQIGAAGYWNNVETSGPDVPVSVYVDFFEDLYFFEH
jgi:hypothetical protein